MRVLCDGFLRSAAEYRLARRRRPAMNPPVRPRDLLRVFAKVSEAKPSTNTPDRGVLVNEIEVPNQNDETVMTMQAMTMLYRHLVL